LNDAQPVNINAAARIRILYDFIVNICYQTTK